MAVVWNKGQLIPDQRAGGSHKPTVAGKEEPRMLLINQIRHTIFAANISVLISVLCSLLLLGCGDCVDTVEKAADRIAEESAKKPKFLVVLADETESFALYKRGEITPIRISSIEGNIQDVEWELNAGKVCQQLRDAFLKARYFLPEQPKFREIGESEWVVEDYLIKKENGRLNLYATVFWPEILPWIARMASHLEQGDKFCVIGIDEQGFNTDDVRIDIKSISESFMESRQQKIQMVKDLKQLTRRQEKHTKTDVLGALYHAAYLLNNQANENGKNTHRGLIAIFSDLIQEPALPNIQDASNLKFPADTEIYCFYVNATGKERWDKLVETWTEVLSSTGLPATNIRFYQRAEMASKFDEVYTFH